MSLTDILIKLSKKLALKKVFDSATGIYFDGVKIFGVHLNKIKTVDEQYHWQIIDTVEIPLNVTNLFDENNPNNIAEIVAEKVATTCSMHNWDMKFMALCLNINDVVIDFEDLSILPEDKIANAVHYQIAATGDFEVNTFLSAFMEIESEMWMEGILKAEADKWINAWEKNGMKLLALTAMPDSINKVDGIKMANANENFIKSDGLKAIFAAKVLASRQMPNFLIDKTADLTDWNIHKIGTIICLVMMCISGFVLGIDIWQLQNAELSLSQEKKNLELLEQDRRKEEIIAKTLKEVENKNKVLTKLQKDSFAWRKLLIHFGKIKVKGVWLKEIHNNDNKMIEIKGEAINFASMAKYVQTLENDKIFSKNKPTMKSSELQRDSGIIKFTINLPIVNGYS